jgi:hypothetical protein
MAEIVNLRRARKQRDRQEREKTAQENRVAFGLLKSERELTKAREDLERNRLDAHRLGKPPDET